MAKPKQKNFCIALDPDDCGSVISGYVRMPEMRQSKHGKRLWDVQFGASLNLTDCSRCISWEFGTSHGNGFNIDKIDRAIELLQAMRSQMVLGQKQLVAARKKMDELNKQLDPKYEPYVWDD